MGAKWNLNKVCHQLGPGPIEPAHGKWAGLLSGSGPIPNDQTPLGGTRAGDCTYPTRL